MFKSINHIFKNNRGNFSILIEEKERWDTVGYPDIRIKFSIKVTNDNNNDWLVNIGDVICYIDKYKGDELIKKENSLKNILIDAVEKIINLDTPGNHNITSDSLDFRDKRNDDL